MISSILPPGVRFAEAFADAERALLSAEEEGLLANAVESRRREFATGRACARRALAALGVPPVSIGSGRHGEPIWPHGVVGSITHCEGYRAAAVARSSALAALGIDAEPAAPLPPGLIAAIADPGELGPLAELRRGDPAIPWDRLAFSLKESTYKAWFALARLTLSPAEIRVAIEPGTGRFRASVHPREERGRGWREPPGRFHGRWTVARGLLASVAWPCPRDGRRAAAVRPGR